MLPRRHLLFVANATPSSARLSLVLERLRSSPGVAYVYAPDRKSERPIAHLEGFKGILQVDGYAGYRKLADRGDVRLAFCWSHVRRGFYELATPGPAPIASEALEHIAALYAVEKDNFLAFIELASIRIWLRVNEPAP
jgi:hypothetical protein